VNTDNDNIPEGADDADAAATTSRPLGYWLRVLDSLITREFASAFESEGADRRDWMMLNALDGDVDAPGLTERLARKGKRLRRLEDRGWVEEQGDGTWALTEEGARAKERLGTVVSGIRSRVAGAVSPEDYATTLATLEAIARELGWDENDPFPRGRGFGPGRFGGPRPFRPEIRFGWGPNLHHGFEPGRPGRPGTDPSGGRSPRNAWRDHAGENDGCHGHGHRGHHGHHDHHGRPDEHRHGRGRGRSGERAFERGFAAGFAASERRGSSAA
jgi:hypothetical protein